jgi:hypothetical protein
VAGKPTAVSAFTNDVGYITSAGSVAWGNVAGKPTAVSAFTNDAGYMTPGNVTVTGGSIASVAIRDIKEITHDTTPVLVGATVTYNYGSTYADIQVLSSSVAITTAGWTTGANQSITLQIEIPDIAYSITILDTSPIIFTVSTPGIYNLVITHATNNTLSQTIAFATTSYNFDYSVAEFQRFSPVANSTVSFSNWPATAYYGKMRIFVHVALITNSVTFPATVTMGTTSITGFAGLVWSPLSTGNYMFEVSSYDGGANYIILELLKP